MIVLGIDPGARETGWCVVDTSTREVLHHDVVERASGGPLLPVPTEYLDAVATIVTVREAVNPRIDLIAVETIVRPSWHMAGRAAANPEALLACAVVAGAAIAAHCAVDVVQVRPGRNGSNFLGTYPPQLVSDAERRKAGWQMRVGEGRLRHARSAYDVALQAARYAHPSHRGAAPR